jgi:hypothetical protein
VDDGVGVAGGDTVAFDGGHEAFLERS